MVFLDILKGGSVLMGAFGSELHTLLNLVFDDDHPNGPGVQGPHEPIRSRLRAQTSEGRSQCSPRCRGCQGNYLELNSGQQGAVSLGMGSREEHVACV